MSPPTNVDIAPSCPTSPPVYSTGHRMAGPEWAGPYCLFFGEQFRSSGTGTPTGNRGTPIAQTEFAGVMTKQGPLIPLRKPADPRRLLPSEPWRTMRGQEVVMKKALGFVALFALVAALNTGCGPKTDCRAAQGACAATVDCCDGLICEKNACVDPKMTMSLPDMAAPAAICGDGNCNGGETQATCCTDCGCSAGLSCRAGTCQTTGGGAMCGNGKCETGESSATCCGDCGCPSGLVCQANQCVTPATTLMWTVTNSCFNGEDIQFRYFSQVRNWIWPGPPNVFISKQGAVNTQPLTCNPGEKICLGGSQPGHGFSWGVGINNSTTCTNCCFLCANQSVSSPPLTCN